LYSKLMWRYTYLHIMTGVLCADKLTSHKLLDLLEARMKDLYEVGPYTR
jgi:hypothetical protein